LKHILNTAHAYGNITAAMKAIKVEKRGKHINILKNNHVCKVIKNILHMNEDYIDMDEPIFEALQELYTR
jgi:hypothetical protein